MPGDAAIIYSANIIIITGQSIRHRREITGTCDRITTVIGTNICVVTNDFWSTGACPDVTGILGACVAVQVAGGSIGHGLSLTVVEVAPRRQTNAQIACILLTGAIRGGSRSTCTGLATVILGAAVSIGVAVRAV